MRAFYFPFLRIDVVGPLANVFHEAQRLLAVSDKGKAARRARGQCHGLFPKVIDRLGRVKFGLWECRLVESRAERERRVGNYVLAFFHAQFHAGVDDVKLFHHVIIYGKPSRRYRPKATVGFHHGEVANQLFV